MNVEGFFLGSGFALLIVLLGWANQITSKSKETKELEKDFLVKAKLKNEDYKKIINNGGATDDSFNTLIDFLYTTKTEDVEVFEKIKIVKKNIQKFDRKYYCRFWILLFMSISFFINGTIAFFVSDEYDFMLLIPNLVFIVLIICNLINVYNTEKEYITNISDIMEKL